MPNRNEWRTKFTDYGTSPGAYDNARVANLTYALPPSIKDKFLNRLTMEFAWFKVHFSQLKAFFKKEAAPPQKPLVAVKTTLTISDQSSIHSSILLKPDLNRQDTTAPAPHKD